MATHTNDTFFNGRIQIKQARAGYRFSIDAVLLAHHARPDTGDTVLDLGTGCGIIPLIMAHRYSDIRISGIEIQQDLARIAKINVKENCMEDRIRILCNDIKAIKQDITNGPVDLIVSNPPYQKAYSGRTNPNTQKAIARHEIKMTLPDLLEAAGRLLRTMGKIVMIYPAQRAADIFIRMRAVRIEPKILRTIHSKENTEAKLILVEGAKAGRPGVKIAPPLIIYKENGTYTREVEQMFQP